MVKKLKMQARNTFLKESKILIKNDFHNFSTNMTNKKIKCVTLLYVSGNAFV